MFFLSPPNIHYSIIEYKMKSVISYPNRGPWGDSNWRGNCSGWVIHDLINQYQPSLFVDACEGSGTSGDVCKERDVEYIGLDLHKGNDFTCDYILNQLPRPADVCFSHPPYKDMIKYNANLSDSMVKNDLSRCKSVATFLEMSEVMLLNQREAVKKGGVYCTLIGDMRKNGMFHSFQADYIKLMPKDELVANVIKIQHNCVSDNKKYSGKFIPIAHEYLIIWKKKAKSVFLISLEKACEYQNRIVSSWRSAIRLAMMKLGGKANLNLIYKEVESIARHLIKNNQHWKAKIRQKLQLYYNQVERGVWSV